VHILLVRKKKLLNTVIWCVIHSNKDTVGNTVVQILMAVEVEKLNLFTWLSAKGSDFFHFQKNYLCNGYALLSRSMPCVQMYYDPPANPPNRRNTDLLLCVDVVDWWMTIRRKRMMILK
jgi:hypothetical protein